MVITVIVALGSCKLNICRLGYLPGFRMVFLIVPGHKGLLDVFGKGTVQIPSSIARGFREQVFLQNKIIPTKIDHPFSSHDPGALATAGTIGKIHPELYLESRMLLGFGILHNSRHDIRYIPAIFPIAELAGGNDNRKSTRLKS